MIDRDINFFRINFNIKKASTDMKYFPDFSSIFHKIIDLYNTENIYSLRGDENKVLMLIDTPRNEIKNDSQFIRGRLILSRQDILPPVEKRGNLTDLPIPEDSGLAEMSHFVLFKHENKYYLALERNVFCTHIRAWSKYIKEKCKDFLNSVKYSILVTKEFLDILDNNKKVNVANISIKKNNLSRLTDFNKNIKAAFEAAAKTSSNIKGSLKLGMSFRDKGFPFLSLFSKRKSEVKTLINNDTFREILSSFIIEADDGRSINLLKFKYCKSVNINKTGRTLDVEDFYQKIEAIINENLSEISQADEL